MKSVICDDTLHFNSMTVIFKLGRKGQNERKELKLVDSFPGDTLKGAMTHTSPLEELVYFLIIVT